MQNLQFTINEEENHLLTFNSPISIDNGYKNVYQGEFESTMELRIYEDSDTGLLSTKRNGCGSIEWIVEEADLCEYIGVWWEDGKLRDYDGVFDFPSQAKRLLNKFGVSVPREF
jgi:hypothetical protein